MPAFSTSVAATTRAQTLDAAQRGQVAQRGIGADDDIASPAAVTSVRAAPRHVLLATEAEPAVAAAAGLDANLDAV
jgi:hypothetical protein